MNSTEHKRLSAKARKVCLAALRKLARENGLTAQHVAAGGRTMTKAGFAISNHVGMGMYIWAGWVIMGKNGYISAFPHGEDYHTMLRKKNDGPGYASINDWEKFIAKGGCLAYVNFCHGESLFADNFHPSSRKKVETMFKILEISKESCAWGRKTIWETAQR